jgi:hypothetical protein
MPKPSKSKFKFRLFYILEGFVVLAVVGQALLIQQLLTRTDQLQNDQLKTILVDGSKNLNTTLAVDPQTGRQFIPSRHVVLPAKLDSQLYYRDIPDSPALWMIDAASQSQAAVQVRNADNLPAIGDEVKKLQQCSRQVVVSFDVKDPKDSSDNLTLEFTKRLKDGRTAYIYKNDCPYNADPLLRSVEQIESF